MADEALKVPKRAVAVELALAGREPRPVEVYVAEHQAHAFRRQDVLDLLEHEQAFLPARDVADGAWVMFNKDTVVWMSLPVAALGEDADDDGGDELFDYRREVRVEVHGGPPLEGELLYSTPAERARVVDYLNQTGRFVRLWTADRLYLVNKAYVLRVAERVR